MRNGRAKTCNRKKCGDKAVIGECKFKNEKMDKWMHLVKHRELFPGAKMDAMMDCIYVRCLPRAVTAGSQYTGKRLQAVRGIYLYFLLPVMGFRPGRQGSGRGMSALRSIEGEEWYTHNKEQ